MFKKIFHDHRDPILTFAVLLVAYFPALRIMWDKWFSADSYYSHGILIPFVTGFLIWQKRDELAGIEIKRSPWGMALIVAGLLFYAAAALFRINFIADFSMMPVIVGLVLHFYGVKIARAVWFPLFFLVFMLPLPSVVIVNISFKMKLFAAEIAKIIINNIGIHAVRNGSIISMSHAQVVVDDVCSGLRSLISLAALASIFAYWMKGPMFKKAVLLLMTPPIAVVTNVCRVVFLASVSEIWGHQYAEGFVHDFSGFMVFGLAFVMLLAVCKLIE